MKKKNFTKDYFKWFVIAIIVVLGFSALTWVAGIFLPTEGKIWTFFNNAGTVSGLLGSIFAFISFAFNKCAISECMP